MTLRKLVPYVVVPVALVFGTALVSGDVGKKATIGAAMPEFSMTDVQGKAHKLSDYKGKVAVLNFMSKDCPWSAGRKPAPHFSSVPFTISPLITIMSFIHPNRERCASW